MLNLREISLKIRRKRNASLMGVALSHINVAEVARKLDAGTIITVANAYVMYVCRLMQFAQISLRE